MKQWNFLSGLTIILLLLMTLGGYCVWISNTLSEDIGSLISRNYDTLRAVSDLRTANARINTTFLAVRDPSEFGDKLSVYEHERRSLLENLERIKRASTTPLEQKAAERLEALIDDFFSAISRLLSLSPRAQDEFAVQQASLGRLDIEIVTVCEQLVDINHQAIIDQRAAAMERGKRASYVSLGIVLMSLSIYGYTSLRLTQGVFKPMRQLRDSIMRVRERNFAELVPIKGEGELSKIAETFNEMAADLHEYILEQDDRVVESNRICRAIMEALPKPVYIVNKNFEVKMLNPRAERFSEALGVPGQLPSVVRHLVDDAAARGFELVGDDLRRAIEVDVKGYLPGGGKRSFLPQVFSMETDAGVKDGWAVLLMDVTNLRRLDEAKTKAVSTIGHEVKTPVTSIRMTLHLLLEEHVGKLTADQRELIEAGRDDCERLLAVLQSLLELARLESGRVALKPVPTLPIELLDQVDAMHGSLVTNSRRELVQEAVVDTLPLVLADTVHAGRVLGNFVANAVKYGVEGKPITLRAIARADGFVRFSVINFCEQEISEQDQARLFEPFFRRAGEKVEGAGLGLTIAREIAGLHHGRVGVWSGEGQVEFYLDLPVAST